MSNMSTYRTKAAIAAQVIIIIVIYIVVFAINKVPFKLNWDAIRLVPSVVSIYAVLLLLFIKWFWRLSIFKHWLVLIPDLQGTWKGELRTTWRYENTQREPDPIEVYLVIKQNLYAMHITMYTKESASYSQAAATNINEESGIKSLHYIYSNQPKTDYRDRSQIHYGAANLLISLKPQSKIEGDYWTDRHSTGSMTLYFQSKELIDTFPNSNI